MKNEHLITFTNISYHMSITEFFDLRNGLVVQPKQMTTAQISQHLLLEKLTMAERVFYEEYTETNGKMKNASYFDSIMKKIDPSHTSAYNIDELVMAMIEERKYLITFNDERRQVIQDTFKLLYNYGMNVYGLYGYAGAGHHTAQ